MWNCHRALTSEIDFEWSTCVTEQQGKIVKTQRVSNEWLNMLTVKILYEYMHEQYNICLYAIFNFDINFRFLQKYFKCLKFKCQYDKFVFNQLTQGVVGCTRNVFILCYVKLCVSFNRILILTDE